MALQSFTVADLRPMPWKNGGGSTREIVCQPPGADMEGFGWRVSIATIAQPGPFSVFLGVDRVITLLDGDGVRLQGQGVDHVLATPLAPFAFSGDVALDCTLLGGTSTDFNVMTRRSQWQAEVQLLRTASTISPSRDGLLLALGGDWDLHDGATGQHCADGSGVWWSDALQGWAARPLSDTAALLVVHFTAALPATAQNAT